MQIPGPAPSQAADRFYAPDEQINTVDYSSQFITWFNAEDPRADLNGDGAVDFYDLPIYGGLYNGQQYGGSLSDANPLGPMNVIGFAGYHWDEELGLWLSRHRVYDPELGRWIQRDPAGYIDGLSLYLYAGGNPFSFIDPTGLARATWRETIGMFFKKETRAEMVRATVSGVGEGVAIAANTYTFGATDALGVTDTSQLNESYHNASRVAATVSRDAAIAATGLGAAQKAAQGGQAANVVAKTANAYDKVQDARDTAGALVAAASGDPAALAMIVVGKAAGSAGSEVSSATRNVDDAAEAVARGSRNPKVAAAAARGREVHKDWDYGPGYDKEVTLPSGKRADAVDREKREVVELKPNNPRAVRRGENKSRSIDKS